MFSSVFCDFGPEFFVSDKDGEEPLECFVGNITKVMSARGAQSFTGFFFSNVDPLYLAITRTS